MVGGAGAGACPTFCLPCRLLRDRRWDAPHHRSAITAIQYAPVTHFTQLMDGTVRVVRRLAPLRLSALGPAVPAIELSAADDGGPTRWVRRLPPSPTSAPPLLSTPHGIRWLQPLHRVEQAAGSASASALDDPRQQYLLAPRDRRTNCAERRRNWLCARPRQTAEVLRRPPGACGQLRRWRWRRTDCVRLLLRQVAPESATGVHPARVRHRCPLQAEEPGLAPSATGRGADFSGSRVSICLKLRSRCSSAMLPADTVGGQGKGR